METVVRKYWGKGAKELFDVLEKHAADVEEVMGTIKGLVAYTLARAGDGGFSVTVCQDHAGIDESVQRAEGRGREECRQHGRGRAAGDARIGHRSPE
jgi:hypothetical protein